MFSLPHLYVHSMPKSVVLLIYLLHLDICKFFISSFELMPLYLHIFISISEAQIAIGFELTIGFALVFNAIHMALISGNS